MRVQIYFFTLCISLHFFSSDILAQRIIKTEVLVAGGGTGGTAAAIQAARSGVKTILVEPTSWLGGMFTAAGVSCADGNDSLPSGIWQAFRQALYDHYGTTQLATGWVSSTCFEPHVGDSIFKAWSAGEPNLTVMHSWHLLRAMKEKNKVTGAIFKNDKGQTIEIHSVICIDATELGDLFAVAGAEYDIGTEDPMESKEKMAPGKTNIIQDATWVAVLKDYGPGTDKTIVKPANYNPQTYYCCCTSAPCTGSPYKTDARGMLDYGKLPGNKYMINWPAHGNDYYMNVVNENDEQRNKTYELARQHTLGFVYFIQTELGFKNLGLADDELNKGLAFIPYNREGRRVKGLVRFNVNHILDPYHQQENLYRTGIAVGDYPVDHHHGQNPNTPQIQFPAIPSFNVPLGVLVPEIIQGLIVCEKGVSVSNIVNGATRLQPVVILTGQAAGVLAAWCIKNNKQPAEADVRDIQQQLLDRKCYLMPYVDVLTKDNDWVAIQRIGLTGILRGTGKAEGWENKTYFYPDSFVTVSELSRNIFQLVGKTVYSNDTSRINAMNLSPIISFLKKVIVNEAGRSSGLVDPVFDGVIDERVFRYCNLANFSRERPLIRREVAVLLDKIVHPFLSFRVDIKGNCIYSSR